MESITFETRLAALTRDVWLISESEHPFSYVQLGIIDPQSLVDLLAQRHQAEQGQVRTITSDKFLSKVEQSTATADAVIKANTQKIKTLLQSLQQQLTQVNVYRVETGVSVPVYILGFLPDGTCVGVSSTSIET